MGWRDGRKKPVVPVDYILTGPCNFFTKKYGPSQAKVCNKCNLWKGRLVIKAGEIDLRRRGRRDRPELSLTFLQWMHETKVKWTTLVLRHYVHLQHVLPAIKRRYEKME